MPVSDKAKQLCLWITEKRGGVGGWFQPQAKSEVTMPTCVSENSLLLWFVSLFTKDPEPLHLTWYSPHFISSSHG